MNRNSQEFGEPQAPEQPDLIAKQPLNTSPINPVPPATPEQWSQKSPRTPSDYTPSTTIGSDSAEKSLSPLDQELSAGSLETVPEGALSFQPPTTNAIVEKELAAALAAKASLESEIAALKHELSKQTADFAHRMEAEHQWCGSQVRQATDIACSLRDANVELTAEIDQLRARLTQLEMEASLDTKEANNYEEGTEQLIAALQFEISDLERKLVKANRARTSAVETEEAALQRAEILQQQVEQMVMLLEEEREENQRLKTALKEAHILPA